MYESIASFYDSNIGDVNYDLMAEFLHKVFVTYGTVSNPDARPILLDAACGTGECTVKMAARGYDMIGLDISPDMLQIASEKPGTEQVMWICQDMAEMDLFGTVQAVFCMTDSINHLLEEEKLQGFIAGASLFTEPGGLLVFDCLTDIYYRDVIDGNTFYQEDEDFCYIWNGEYDGQICDYDITCFERTENDRYIKLKDSVTERMWTDGQLRTVLAEAGYRVVDVFSDLHFTETDGKEERRFYVCRKK